MHSLNSERTHLSDAVNLPLITIITVVYNGKDYIESTIKSVISQTYQNIEYIVIDGNSSDGTQDIIRKYENKISYWCSEEDRGIYDAMNKGLVATNGQWVNFMNAGDTFYSNKTLSDLFIDTFQNVAVIYGGVEIQYTDFSRLEAPGDLSNLWKGMNFSHQSVFFEASYHKKTPYNIQNKITADLELLYQAHMDDKTFYKTEQIISTVVTGGLSEVNRIRTIWGSYKTISKINFKPLFALYYLTKVLDVILRSCMKKILPKKLIKKIILSK